MMFVGQKGHGREQLEHVLLNAIASGDPIDVTAEMVEALREKLRARAAQRNGTAP
jgi:hypothetical protein